MNDKKNNDSLDRLIHASRLAPDHQPTTAPYGFSTRVVAQAFAAKSSNSLSAAFERLSWRALGVAAALMVICVASSYHFTSAPTTNTVDENDLLNQDALSDLIDISS